jgi:putative transposase
MARQLRPYFPGGIFHITARTHGGQPWFDAATRTFICECLAVVQRRCDVKVFAFTIMLNHIHLVVQQGDEPLSRLMQPFLTRVAMSVRRKYELVGHVFGRRYWSHPCLTDDYLQACIAYVHHNPVKAELCGAASEYEWSSASCYLGGSPPAGIAVEPAPLSFATPYAQAIAPYKHQHDARPARSMEHVVLHAIKKSDCEIDVDLLRRMGGRAAAAIRRECIRHAVEAGYRNCQIARYLCVSDSTVSKIAVEVRRNATLGVHV